ncbi:unnamed protein product [Cochlearia groenlandica]
MRTNLNRPINLMISSLIVFLLFTMETASRNWTNRTHQIKERVQVQHAYYSYPHHRSCKSFSRPYARSMCVELERIHRSSRQPLFSPPPPPEIDLRYGVDKRLVPSGPNPLHN